MAGTSGVGALGRFSPSPNNYFRGMLIPKSFNGNTYPNINFLMNPETITESLVGGWVHKSVPGQNDPVSSWVANGTRTVSLSLLLSKDISDYQSTQPSPNASATVNNNTPTILGNLGAAFSGIGVKVLQNIIPKQINNFVPGATGDPAAYTSANPSPKDISAELTIIKSLRYGDTDPTRTYMTPPALVKFQFYANQNNPFSDVVNTTLGTNSSGLGSVYWTVDTIEIVYHKWSNNLDPLEAEVKLTLTQFNDINIVRSDIGTFNG